MRCSLCSHEKRSAIEKAISSGFSIAHVADQFGVSERALSKHATHSRATAKKQPKRALPATSATSLPPPPPPRAISPARPPGRDERDDDDDEGPATSRSPHSQPSARANAFRIAAAIDEMLRLAQADDEASYQEVSTLARAALSANRQLAHLTGEWAASEATVTRSPHFKRLLQAILDALRGERFASARAAIIEALEREEAGAGRAVAA